jgi:hypothetical protein
MRKRRVRKPADPRDGLEKRVRALAGLIRTNAGLDPDRRRALSQARRVRQCGNQVMLLRRRRESERWRAEADRRRQERRADIARSLASLRDRLASRDRFAAELERRLDPGRFV